MREEGLETGVVALTYHRLWAGKPLPLIAWLEKHEPETLAHDRREQLLVFVIVKIREAFTPTTSARRFLRPLAALWTSRCGS